MDLADKFLPYCDNEYASKEDNAENCAEIAAEHAKDFMLFCEGLEMDFFLSTSAEALYAAFEATLKQF